MNHISVFKTVWGKRSDEVMKEELGEPREAGLVRHSRPD